MPVTITINGAGYDSGIVNTKAVSGTAYLVNRIYQRAYYQVGTARAGASFDQSWAYEDMVAAVNTIGEMSLAKVDLLSSGIQTDDLTVSKESLSTSWNPLHGILVVIRVQQLEDGMIRRDQHVFRLKPS